MRLFCAINIVNELKANISNLQTKLRNSGADVKWVEPVNLHLTIKFFGEVKEEKIELISCVGEQVCAQHDRIKIEIAGLGAFPDLKNPRVIWLGISRGSEQIKLLAQKIDEGLATIGFAKESRPFSVHLTLGRTRSNCGKEKLVATINGFKEQKLGGQEIEKVDLMQSILQPQGPVYKVVKNWSLK